MAGEAGTEAARQARQGVREAIARRLVERAGLSIVEARAMVSAVLEGLIEEVERAPVVQVRGLGTFRAVELPARRIRMPDGREVLAPGGRGVRFRGAGKLGVRRQRGS